MSSGTRLHLHENHQTFQGARTRGGTRVHEHGSNGPISGSTHVQIHSEKENDQDYALVEQVGQCTVKHHKPKTPEAPAPDPFDPTPDAEDPAI